ncbi:exodeoxyribonuclease VII small subunit [Amaricoccus sp.]|uniref:exodeoxyribonuclease VII small subunit n=1 Tax=Amaricoccus sp. TaxID=1872485 RepID=UPI001B4F1E4E|nr:exodeoxyribonuclease VII small subunit [Amaricoccus sp.]MBP7241482.1 exodeoxyribonuclease VII small subunit [Amaricoccus sp.]
MADEIPVAEMSFEAALAELEAVVHRLEAGSAPLEESIALYARGAELRSLCEAKLKAAEARVAQIVAGPDGAVTGAKPLDPA